MAQLESKSVRDSDVVPLFGQYDWALDAESDKRLHALLHALPVGVYTTDAAGRITFFNETAAAMWGRRRPKQMVRPPLPLRDAASAPASWRA